MSDTTAHTQAPSGGHQQTGILTPDATLLTLTWVTFFVLMFILHKFAWKPILAGLKKREDYIRKSVEDADKITRQLAEIEQDKTKILNEAKDKANAIIEQSRKMSHEMAMHVEAGAKKNAEEIINSARQELAGERERVLVALKKESVQAAVSLSEKILKENLDTEKNRKLINDAIKDIEPS
ncbi:MAG: F0F1 ATP synthase subunit B [Candidatus Omnitrophica bacterium]|nr:F0F1 ATP synthase subunit B [Candidatus Omnitrophota bacterium]MDE2009710.1 F0F1 ATP synthase subunit B [Candidatus Omnitrophota bacterium]MDE2213893.1 F0F1 ATP synthase subunit B [Candidatus Omnitrophota bacterium]MDE2231848.1 F0F1 ATP synthase subunit B [Candidatus Omnitrophota bacterium]